MTADAARAGHSVQPTGEIASVGGLDAVGWSASLWILHPMRETDELPADITWTEARRLHRTGRGRRRLGVVAEYLDWLALNENARSLTQPPIGGWRRLTWRDLWRRSDVDPDQLEGYPSDGWFPSLGWPPSWPVNIDGPDEGSLDREQFLRLVEHLAAVSPRGRDEECFAYYAYLAAIEFEGDLLYGGCIGDLASLLESDDLDGTPSNIWPADRSWLVYTDFDLWGTKVSGSAHLVARLVADPELETMRLP